MNEEGYRFAGWFLVDIRLGAALTVFSAAFAALALALYFKDRRWDEYVVGFFALFCLALVGSVVLTNLLAAFPALRIETLFPVP